MRYVTINLIAQHVGKHRDTVLRGLRAKGVPMDRQPMENGFRITERDANRFIERHFPGHPPLPVASPSVMENRSA